MRTSSSWSSTARGRLTPAKTGSGDDIGDEGDDEDDEEVGGGGGMGRGWLQSSARDKRVDELIILKVGAGQTCDYWTLVHKHKQADSRQ